MKKMIKINFVDLEKLYNFVVKKFFIWIHLGPQKLLWKNDLPRAKKNAHGKMPQRRILPLPKNSTRQNTYLPSARKKALGKGTFCWVFFLPSVFYLALGKDRLCRVPDKIHSAKPPALSKVPVSGSGSPPLPRNGVESRPSTVGDANLRCSCCPTATMLMDASTRRRASFEVTVRSSSTCTRWSSPPCSSQVSPSPSAGRTSLWSQAEAILVH